MLAWYGFSEKLYIWLKKILHYQQSRNSQQQYELSLTFLYNIISYYVKNCQQRTGERT